MWEETLSVSKYIYPTISSILLISSYQAIAQSENVAASDNQEAAPALAEPLLVSPLPPKHIITATSAPQSVIAPPADKKAAKKLRKKNTADLKLCRNQNILKDWMLVNMIEACDRLLSQTKPFKKNHPERAALLQYRSLALIADNHIDMALEAIEESNAIINQKSNLLSNDSLKQSNKLLLSYIANQKGDKDRALSLIDEVRKARPYSKTFQTKADDFEISYDVSLRNITKRLENRLQIDPDRSRNLIFLYLLDNNLQASYDIGQKLSLIEPRTKKRWRRYGDTGDKGKVNQKILYSGTRAYVASLMGKVDEASTIYTQLEEDFVDYIGNDPRYSVDKNGVRKKKSKFNKKKVKKYNQRLKDTEQFRAIVADWKALTELKLKKQSFTNDEFRAATKDIKHSLTAFPAYLDLMSDITYDTDNDQAVSSDITKDDPTEKLYDIFINTILLGRQKINNNELGPRIFDEEHIDILPKYGSDNRLSFVSGNNGFSQKKEKDSNGDIRTIRFESLSSTAPIIEEMMFLAISDYGKQDGKTKFILLANETVKRTIVTYGYYGTGGNSSNAGYVAQARVKFLNDSEAALESADNQKNIMSLADIDKNLRPKYDNYARMRLEAKAAKKKKKR